MKLYFVVLCLTCIFGCLQHTKKNVSIPETEMHTARQSFRDLGVDNKISKEILDSIILSLPYWRLDKFKTTDFHVLLSIKSLKNNLVLKGFRPDEFVLHLIKKEENGFLSFYLEHTDVYIYRYNLDKLFFELENNPEIEDIEIIPITGNSITPYDGWYTVDPETWTLEFKYRSKY